MNIKHGGTVLCAQILPQELEIHTPSYSPQLPSFSRNSPELKRATSALSKISYFLEQLASTDWQKREYKLQNSGNCWVVAKYLVNVSLRVLGEVDYLPHKSESLEEDLE